MRRLDKMISKKKESKSNIISCPICFFCSASLDNRLLTKTKKKIISSSLPPSLEPLHNNPSDEPDHQDRPSLLPSLPPSLPQSFKIKEGRSSVTFTIKSAKMPLTHANHHDQSSFPPSLPPSLLPSFPPSLPPSLNPSKSLSLLPSLPPSILQNQGRPFFDHFHYKLSKEAIDPREPRTGINGHIVLPEGLKEERREGGREGGR